MNYSEALEQQIRMLAFVPTDARLWEKGGMSRDIIAVDSRHKASILRQAVPFFWDSGPLALLNAARRGVANVPLTEDMMVTKSGFWWFNEPVTVGDDLLRPFRAIFWSQHPRVGYDRGEASPGLRMSWVEMGKHGVRLGPLIVWHFGRSPRGMGLGTEKAASEELGLVNGLAYNLEEIGSLFVAGLLFLQQRILVTPRRVLERHARKRVEREGWGHEPVVRVVELRRKERIGNKHAVESVEREWACQWVVRGHWRQQFYPSKHQNQPIWITPYVKGPEDKPLKPPRATVFAVVR